MEVHQTQAQMQTGTWAPVPDSIRPCTNCKLKKVKVRILSLPDIAVPIKESIATSKVSCVAYLF